MGSGGLQALLCGAVFCVSGGAFAETDREDEELPDAEFLEYLGLWEESDEEWLLLDEDDAADSDERIDPVPEGDESTENDDES